MTPPPKNPAEYAFLYFSFIKWNFAKVSLHFYQIWSFASALFYHSIYYVKAMHYFILFSFFVTERENQLNDILQLQLPL